MRKQKNCEDKKLKYTFVKQDVVEHNKIALMCYDNSEILERKILTFLSFIYQNILKFR